MSNFYLELKSSEFGLIIELESVTLQSSMNIRKEASLALE